MKKEKTIVINGETYELKKFEVINNGETLWSIYNNPSEIKKDIWNCWNQKLNTIYGCIGSKFAFTIYGNVIDSDGNIRDVRISKCHNYIM